MVMTNNMTNMFARIFRKYLKTTVIEYSSSPLTNFNFPSSFWSKNLSNFRLTSPLTNFNFPSSFWSQNLSNFRLTSPLTNFKFPSSFWSHNSITYMFTPHFPSLIIYIAFYFFFKEFTLLSFLVSPSTHFLFETSPKKVENHKEKTGFYILFF